MSVVLAWLAAHRRSVLLVFALLALAGADAARRMPVALFPTIDFPRVVVNIEAGDRPIDRMVVDVTRPLEEALRAVPSVRTVRSTSTRGAADISISFAWGSDMGEAMLLCQSAVNQALPSLPRDITFAVRRMDPVTVFPVLGFSLTSKTRDGTALRDFAVLTLRPLISAIDEVATVEVLGGATAEIHVAVDPMRLAARGVAAVDVASAIESGSGVDALGQIEDHDRLYLVLHDSGLTDVADVKRIVIRADVTASGASVVTVGDIADVARGEVPQWTRVTADGVDAVLVNILQQRGGNTLDLRAAVERTLAEHHDDIPPDVVVKTFYDQGELVSLSSKSVVESIALGALFAALVLFVFLRNLRVTLVVAVVLPAVFAISALVLERMGMSVNIMTLGGLAAASGLIVDDAVVVIEHIARRRERDALAAPLASGLEMLRPLSGSSIATIVVFAPLAFLGGVAGGFFKALAVTIAVCLAVSWAVAIVVVPLVADRFFTSEVPGAHAPGAGLQRHYRAIMSRALRTPLLAVPVLLAVLALGLLGFVNVGQGFMPRLDEGGFILDYNAPPGMSLSETDRLLRLVEDRIQALPEVESYSRRTGLQLGGGLTESNSGDFFIDLKPEVSGKTRRPIEEVMTDIREQIEGEIPGLRIETMQLLEDVIGDLTAVPQPVEVKLFGADERALAAAADEVAVALAKVEGLVEVFNGITIAGDDVEVNPDPVRCALEGLTPAEVAAQLAVLVDGVVAAQMRHGEQTLGVRVTTPRDARRRIEQLRALRLSVDGRTLPLSRVADIVVREGRAEVTRENLKQMIGVTADVEGRDLGSAMTEVKAAVAALTLPPGVTVQYGGLYAEQQRSLRELTIVFIAAVLLVLVLLSFIYERAAVVAAVLTTTVLSTSGVLVGLWLTGIDLNLSSMMGLTMIVGIVTELAIFFFAELSLQTRTGEAARIDADALVEAGAQRLRPILMTSIIAVLALLPLALGFGGGAGMQAPLAVAIISGLVVAVPLVLIGMPLMFALLSRVRRA